MSEVGRLYLDIMVTNNDQPFMFVNEISVLVQGERNA